MKTLRMPVLLGIALSASSAAMCADPAVSDDRAIRELVTQWEVAWNAHDMKDMGSLLTEDADFVNVAGLHWKGKPQIEAEHATRHRTNLKNSVWLTRKTSVQRLAPNFALVHIEWGMSGDTDFDGTSRQPREGIFSWLVTKREGRWLIRAVQNTNITASK